MKFQKFGLASLTAIAFYLLIACHVPFDCEKGKGEIVEQQIELKSFEKIRLKGSSTVYLTKSDEQRVVIKGQQNLIDILNTEVKDDTWDIKFEKCVNNMKGFEVYVSLPTITEASIYGSGDIISKEGIFATGDIEFNILGSGDIKINANAKNVTSSIKGSGDIELKGTAVKHDIHIAGSGDVKALELVSKDVNVDIKGSGDVKVNCADNLDVSILGSGDVHYSGNPKNVNNNVKGSGDVKKIN